MNCLLLSIVTISKDDPAGLDRTVASVAQWRMHPGVEHIVVYHGVRPIIDDLTIQLRCQTSHGIAAAFNEGLDCVRGEWVWFLNGGDEIDPRLKPDWLLDLLAVTQADVLVGGVTYDGDTSMHPHPPVARCWPPIQPWIPHPATLVRRGLFARFGGFDRRYAVAMDYEWWLRTLPVDARVDVLSIPFSIFAGGGISQRPEGRSLVAREKSDVIRRYAFRLWKDWLLAGGRLFKESASAFCSRRPGRKE